MAISQIITAFPPAPNAGSDTPEEFSNKADAFVAHQSDNYTPEVNQWATEANSTASLVNDDATTSGTNASNAAASAVLANEWAENPEDVPVVAGEFSALHWAAKAATFNPALYALIAGDTFTGNIEAPSMSIDGNNVDVVDYGIESTATYVKYPDGTLECFESLGVSLGIDSPNGSLFMSNAIASRAFDSAFITDPIVSVTLSNTSAGSNLWVISAGVVTNSLTHWGEVKLSSATSKTAAVVDVTLMYHAIGRWK